MTDIHRTRREVLENKLLVALDDPGNVAIIATEKDLQLMIDAMICYTSLPNLTEAERSKSIEMTADLIRLQEAAFQ